MSKLWKIKPCDDALAQALSLALDGRGALPTAIPRPLISLFAQRGCKTVVDIDRQMNSSLGDLRDPFDLPDMHPAVERIRRALIAGERMTVFGDYDADGICSTALLTRALRELGGKVEPFIPNRLGEGYGLSADALSICIEKNNPSLIITVDCGTNAVESVERARALGIDVVVTDHHEPGNAIAAAVAVVNPKRVENHPDAILAGVGVAFKLCHALVKAGRDAGCVSSAGIDLREYLDFVAVATITDMVPLLDENRILVRAGLQSLEKSRWAGWIALKKKAGVYGQVETWHAGFAFGPRINAAGRIGRADAALDLFLTDLPSRADEQARFLDDANRERQSIEKEIVREALLEIESTFDPARDFGIVIAREGWHIGVVGIVASRLVARYGRPVVVIGMEGDCGRGSCRSIDSFNVLDGLHACSDQLKQFGGHAMAAGLELEEKNLEAFTAQFKAYAASRLKDGDLQPVLEIDGVINLADANAALLDGLKRAGPFGQDNPEPVWAVLGIDVAESRILKEVHLKLGLADGAARINAIGFNMAEKLPVGPVDIAFTLQENCWNGRSSLQLNLKDIRPAQ